MNFKDQLQKDLNVFMNPKEFAEEAIIDGVPVTVVIDNGLFDKRSTPNRIEGLYLDQLIFHVKKSDITKPVVGEMMKFNDERYNVTSVQEMGGMLTITLGATMS